MEFRPLKAEDLTAYEELPGYIYQKLAGDGIAWGGFDADRITLLGFVIVSPDPIEKNRAFLDYIHVREDRRRQGIGTDLLKNMEIQLMNNRISSLYAKVISNNTECKGIYDFLVKNECIPTVFNGKLLEYKISQISAAGLIESFSEAVRRKLKIESFDAIEPFAKRKIMAICWANNISVSEQVISSEYTMIMNKQLLEGFLAVQRINESMLYVWDSYMRDPKTRDITFLSMLAATIEKSLKDGSLNPGGTVVISVSDQTLVNGLSKRIGDPVSEKCQQEFSKLLRRS